MKERHEYPPRGMSVLELIAVRCRFMLRLADVYKWAVPNIIIRNEMRMLREAIERWEAGQRRFEMKQAEFIKMVVGHTIIGIRFTRTGSFGEAIEEDELVIDSVELSDGIRICLSGEGGIDRSNVNAVIRKRRTKDEAN